MGGSKTGSRNVARSGGVQHHRIERWIYWLEVITCPGSKIATIGRGTEMEGWLLQGSGGIAGGYRRGIAGGIAVEEVVRVLAEGDEAALREEVRLSAEEAEVNKKHKPIHSSERAPRKPIQKDFVRSPEPGLVPRLDGGTGLML